MVVIVDNIVDADTREITGKYVITTVRLGLMSIREKILKQGCSFPFGIFSATQRANTENQLFYSIQMSLNPF